MRDKDFDTGGSWSIAFFTTSVCSFIFIFFLKLIDNRFPRFFLWIGFASFVLGCFSLLKTILFQKKIEVAESEGEA